MLEKEIEAWFVDQVEQLGGLALKLTSPGNAGVPDRLCILPGGDIWFVELKRPTGRTAKLQSWWGRKLTALGCRYRKISTREEAEQFIRERKQKGDSA